ncbi:MAG: hypothetical protein WBM69_08115 [Desulfobacterales bacterium]
MNVTISKLIAVTAASILLMSAPVASGMRAMGLDESSGQADIQGSKPLKQNSIVLAENDDNTSDDKEKTSSGSETKGSEPGSEPAADDKNKSSNATSKPLKPFVPSEKIPGEQAVDFPVDI